MLDRRPQLGSQTGQTAAEAMGVLLLVSLIIAALVISGVGQAITDRTAELICKIAGSSREQPERTVDGKPWPYMCATNSSQRGLAGAVKISFVGIGSGVQAIKEIRADGSVKITIKRNAEAGLEFGAPVPRSTPAVPTPRCPAGRSASSTAASTAARGRSRPRRRPTSSSTSSPAR